MQSRRRMSWSEWRRVIGKTALEGITVIVGDYGFFDEMFKICIINLAVPLSGINNNVHLSLRSKNCIPYYPIYLHAHSEAPFPRFILILHHFIPWSQIPKNISSTELCFLRPACRLTLPDNLSWQLYYVLIKTSNNIRLYVEFSPDTR